MRPADSKRPTHDGDVDCETHLAAHVRLLVVRAVEAGWTEEEVANALLSYAQTMILKLNDEAVIPDDGGPPRTIQ